MNVLEYLRLSRRSFGTKIIALFTLLIIIVYLSFSSFLIYYQSRMMEEHVLYAGEQLAGLLAHSSRLGVFAEDRELLQGPLEGGLQYDEAVMVQVFNAEGRVLSSLKKPGASYAGASDNEAFSRAMEENDRTGSIVHIEKGDMIEFWAPVTSRGTYSEEELFFKEGTSDAGEKVIGYVRAVFTTTVLKKQLRNVIIKSTVVPFLFLVASWFIAYFIVTGITGPLKKLTKGVKSLESTGKFEKVSVQTGDEVGRLAAAFNDMTDALVQREREKAALEEHLRHAQKMEAIGTFSGGIAHDFNNIMTVIKSYSQMLRKKGITEGDEGKYLERVLASAEKASALTRSLLAFSRKQTIRPCAVKLNEMLSYAEDMLRPLFDERIELKVMLPDEDFIVMADRVHMEQVLMNLATNARDAMPEGGSLRIRAAAADMGRMPVLLKNREVDGYCVISVSDTGTGMDRQTMERIFDPFFTTKDVGKGTGLGLSLAYGIVEQHGGYIDVRSEPGQGTTFDIYLPLTDAAVVEGKESDVSEVKGGTETVLLAEDDEDVRNLMSMVLEKAGYRVIEAADGGEALEFFSRSKDEVKLLLLDVMMPEKGGPEVYAEIRKTAPDVKVLFISGYTDKASEGRGCDETPLLEGEQLLYKPVVPDDLLRKVREILDRKGSRGRGV